MSPFGNASLESQCPVGPLESVAKTWSLHAVVLCTIPCIIHYNGAPSLVRYSGTELLLILLTNQLVRVSPFGNASLESQCPVGPLESVAKTWSLHAVVLCTIPCIID